MPHPTPTKEGHYWAKLIHPHRMPASESWESVEYEVVYVSDNNGDGVDEWRVMVPGVEVGQLIDAFIWGPEVPQYKP